MSNTIKILSSEAKVHTIGYAYAQTAQGAGSSALSFRLLPGLNEVNAEAWAQAKKLKVIAWYVKTGAFREVTTKSPGLRGHSVEEAIDMVNQTLDRALLKEWKSHETREAVITAIELQVDEVTFRPERDAAGNAKPASDDGFDLAPRSAQSGFTGAELAEQMQTEAPPERLEVHDAPKVTPPQRAPSSKEHPASSAKKGHRK